MSTSRLGSGTETFAAAFRRDRDAARCFDVELRQDRNVSRATFYPVGIAHLIVRGTAYDPTPWRAVQRAAWAALNDPRAAA